MRNQVILKDSDLTSILLIVMVAAATAIFLALRVGIALPLIRRDRQHDGRRNARRVHLSIRVIQVLVRPRQGDRRQEPAFKVPEVAAVQHHSPTTAQHSQSLGARQPQRPCHRVSNMPTYLSPP